MPLLDFLRKHKPLPATPSAVQPPEIMDAEGNVAFSHGGEVYVMAETAGTFAVKNSRHKPLPTTGPRAVYIPNGTKGVVRGVAMDTVMVDFPPPVGLVHVAKADVRNPVVSDLRQRWAAVIAAADEALASVPAVTDLRTAESLGRKVAAQFADADGVSVVSAPGDRACSRTSDGHVIIFATKVIWDRR